ncbi:unnamed protein product [Discosporangium mesarthrocarpum]
MHNWVLVYKMWFYIMRDGARIYLRPNEAVPTPPRNPSKHFISKVMFLMAVASPWQLSTEGLVQWQVIETIKTNRSSKNCAAGDMEVKTVTMDWEQYKQMMVKEVIPAIKATIPGASTCTIWVQ